MLKPEDIQITVDEKDPGSWKIAAMFASDPQAPFACTKLNAEFNEKEPISIRAETDLAETAPINLRDYKQCTKLNKEFFGAPTPDQWKNLKASDVTLEISARPIGSLMMDYLKRRLAAPLGTHVDFPDRWTRTITLELADDPTAGLFTKSILVESNKKGEIKDVEISLNAEELPYFTARELQDKLKACDVVLTSDQWAQFKYEDFKIGKDDNGWTLQAKFSEDSHPPFTCKSVKAHFEPGGKLVVDAESNLPNLTDYKKCRALQKLEEYGIQATPYQWEHLQPRQISIYRDSSVSAILPLDPEAAFQFYNVYSFTTFPSSVTGLYIDRAQDEGLTDKAAISVEKMGGEFTQRITKNNWKTMDRKTISKPDYSDKFAETKLTVQTGDLFEKWIQGNPDLTPERRDQFLNNVSLIDALIANHLYQTKSPELIEIGHAYSDHLKEVRTVRKDQQKNKVPEDEIAKTYIANYREAQNQARASFQKVHQGQALAKGLIVEQKALGEAVESAAQGQISS